MYTAHLTIVRSPQAMTYFSWILFVVCFCGKSPPSTPPSEHRLPKGRIRFLFEYQDIKVQGPQLIRRARKTEPGSFLFFCFLASLLSIKNLNCSDINTSTCAVCFDQSRYSIGMCCQSWIKALFPVSVLGAGSYTQTRELGCTGRC